MSLRSVIFLAVLPTVVGCDYDDDYCCGSGLTYQEEAFLAEDVTDLMTTVFATGENAFDGDAPQPADVTQIADQPKVVERSVGEFQKSLAEALLIVMAVSFISLGWRTGIVVALAVPLVLAGTMVAMLILGILTRLLELGARQTGAWRAAELPDRWRLAFREQALARLQEAIQADSLAMDQ